MIKTFYTVGRVALAGVLLLVTVVAGGDTARAADNDGERAQQVLQRMSAYLSAAKAFSVTIDVAYDIVQDWGQKIEFGETRRVTVRRPDRLRVETTDRHGPVSGIVFDGQAITAFDVDEKVYATAAKPGTLDQAIKYFVNDLGMRLPMAGFLTPTLPEDVAAWAETSAYIEEATIGGVRCDHLAFSGEWEDVQLWISQGDKPLLQRVVITYTRAEAQPQFSAQFKEWNFSPKASDSVFAFTPAKGAAKIAFDAQQGAGIHPGVVELKDGEK